MHSESGGVGVSRAAGGLQCPSCGAPAPDVTKAECGYCGTTLSALACPRCQARLAAGSRFCVFCGTAAVQPVETDASWPCPCGRVLRDTAVAPPVGVAGGVLHVAECARCHGVWVDKTSGERLIASAVSETTLFAMVPGLGSTAVHDDMAGSTAFAYRACPVCRKLMNRVNFAKTSGVVIDVCRDDGTFFDHNELPELLRFVRRGGLKVAEQRETDALGEARRQSAFRRTISSSPVVGDATPTAGVAEDTLSTGATVLVTLAREWVRSFR